MLEIILQIIDDHMTQPSTDQHAEKYAEHEVVEVLFEKSLQTREFRSENILFGDPIEEKISREKCDEIEYAIPVNIERTK